MDDTIYSCERCVITRDVVIDGEVAFESGEIVVVEKIDPNRSRPLYRYVVYSARQARRFQLSDSELALEPRLQSRSEGLFRRTLGFARDHKVPVGAAALVVAAAAVTLLLVFTGGGGASGSCWVVGNRGEVLKAISGGDEWFPAEKESVRSYRGVSAAGSTVLVVGRKAGHEPVAYVIAEGGSVRKEGTHDAGGPYGILNGVAAVDEKTAWAVGYRQEGEESGITASGGTILKTADGGFTWKVQDPDGKAPLFSVAAANASTALAVGDGGAVLATTDGGESWTLQNSAAAGDLLGVCAVDSRNAITVGQGGTVCTTVNGGAGWSRRDSGTLEHLYGVCAVDTHTAWVVGTNGTILKTTDGGETWKPQESGTGRNLRGAAAADTGTVWAVGDGGTILKTTDGGKTWKAQESGTESDLWSVSLP